MEKILYKSLDDNISLPTDFKNLKIKDFEKKDLSFQKEHLYQLIKLKLITNDDKYISKLGQIPSPVSTEVFQMLMPLNKEDNMKIGLTIQTILLEKEFESFDELLLFDENKNVKQNIEKISEISLPFISY